MFAYQTAALRRGDGVASIITFGSPIDLHRGLPAIRRDVTGAIVCNCRISSTLAFDKPIQRTLPSFCNAANVFQPSTVSCKSSAVQWI